MSYVWYVAGRSAGHILPAIRRARDEEDAVPIIFTTTASLDKSIMREHGRGINHIALPLPSVPRCLWKAPFFCVCLIYSLFYILWYRIRYRPIKVLSTGGYLGIPFFIIAHLTYIPTYVYEFNAIPGKAVQLMHRLAEVTYICFEEARQYFRFPDRCQLIPYPLHWQRDSVRMIAVPPRHKVIVIVGGSQGSAWLNENVTQALKILQKRYPLYVIHQTGGNGEWVQQFYDACGIDAIVEPYFSRLHYYYICADLVIGRAGAGMLWDIMACQVPAICVPLEADTTDHQVANAYAAYKRAPYIAVHRQSVIDVDMLVSVIADKLIQQ